MINGLLKGIFYKKIFSPYCFGISLIVIRLWYCSGCSLAMDKVNLNLLEISCVSLWFHSLPGVTSFILHLFLCFLLLALLLLQHCKLFQYDHFDHSFLIFSIFIIVSIVYCQYNWKFSELISILLHASHTRSWKASWNWNGEATTYTAAFLEDPLAVFLCLLIYFSYNYFKYQRKSEAELYLFRNQVSSVTLTLCYRKPFRNTRPLGSLVSWWSLWFIEVSKKFLWFSWKYGFVPKRSLWFFLPGGKGFHTLRLDSHCRCLCFSALVDLVGYDQMESQVDHSYSEPFWTFEILGFKDSTCKNIFGVWQWWYLVS